MHDVTNLFFFSNSQRLLSAEQAPVSGFIHLETLVVAYENHSPNWPAPVTDTFTRPEGILLQS